MRIYLSVMSLPMYCDYVVMVFSTIPGYMEFLNSKMNQYEKEQNGIR